MPCHQSGWAVTASPRLSTRGRREPVHWWLRGLRDGQEGAWLLMGGAPGRRGARMDTRVCTRVCGRVLVHTDTRAWGGGRGHLSPESGGPGQPGRRGCEQSPCGPGQEGQPQVGGLAWCPLCVASGRAPASLGLSPQVLPLPSRGSDRLTGKTGRLGPRAPMSVSGARLGSLVLPPRSCRTPQPSVLCEGAGGRVRWEQGPGAGGHDGMGRAFPAGGPGQGGAAGRGGRWEGAGGGRLSAVESDPLGTEKTL